MQVDLAYQTISNNYWKINSILMNSLRKVDLLNINIFNKQVRFV